MASPTTRFIPVSMPSLLGNEKRYVNDCLDTVWISSIGKYITEFERKFAEFCDVPHAIACSNGTTALHLALLANGVVPGDEVLVPTLTYVASANAVRYCGAEPVLLEADPETMNLDPARIEERITRRTRGILVVHLYGHPVDMDPVMELARQRGLFVVEDAAEAHGALYRGRKVGSIADTATFSFFGNKIITTGEGGMVVTRRRDLADRMRLLRGQGMDPERRYWFPVVGYNYRMTNIQAAIGLAQMECIDQHIAMRRRVAEWYDRHLAPLDEFVQRPVELPWARHAYWIYTVLIRDRVRLSNEEFRQFLVDAGVETRPVFYPMHTLPAHNDGRRYPVAERLSDRGVNLPTHGQLTEDDVAYVADTIRRACSRVS